MKSKAPRKARPASRKTARVKGAQKKNGKLPLVCRFSGSDDLAPSFKKRRDRRCQACFKKRYGSKATKKTHAKN